MRVGARGADEAVELATRTTDAQDGHAHAMHISCSTAILVPSPDPPDGYDDHERSNRIKSYRATRLDLPDKRIWVGEAAGGLTEVVSGCRKAALNRHSLSSVESFMDHAT